MERLKKSLIALGVIGIFVVYSYFNYNIRREAVNKVEEYGKEVGLTKIFWLREIHFNLFDWLIEDKTQNNFIFVKKKLIKIKNNNNYFVPFSNWKNPQKNETLTNYTVEKQNRNFKIVIYDQFWNPVDKDSIIENNIKGKIFEIVDNWIKEEYK